MSEKLSFFAELKRRNVYKVAIAYGVVGWLVTEIATQVFPFFEIPNWAVRLVVLAIIIGFPIALVIAWAFELTPEGLKRTETAGAVHQHSKNQTWIYVVLIAGVLSIGLFFLGRYTVSKLPTDRQPSGPSLPAKSIAVLPFENLSHDQDNAYFAEGVQDEILTRLAKVADLKVISRTSTQRFKSAPENLPDIAKQLGVMNILQGSVQKVNDQVRVNVQLINAMSDAHLWADTYDRKLTDIFAVESEIAKTIADTLQAKLTGSELAAMTRAPTANSEAHELYLKGRFFWNKRTGADLLKSIEYLNQAIVKDPNYALAYAGLADSYLLLSLYGAISPGESFPQARAAAEKALELDNTLAEAHASLGLLACFEFDLNQSITELERAIQLNPNYATAHHWLSCMPLNGLGQFDRAIAEGKRAIKLDPLSLICNADLSWVYFNARRYDEAEAQARETLEMDSRFYLAHKDLGEAFQFKGQLTKAIAEYQRAVELDNDPYLLAVLGQAYARNGQAEEAQELLGRLEEEAKSRYVQPYALALILTGLGEKERAIDELERVYRDGIGNYLFAIKVDPMLDDLRGQLRFEALAQKVVGGKR
jgi:TolB-like protein/Tfp pilus assembly protein PilF